MIVNLNAILPKADIQGLPTLEQIAKGHRARAKVAINDNPKLFAYNLLKHSDYLLEAAELLEDQVLIDLGAGRHLDGYIFAEIAGARDYVAVEASHTQKLYERMTNPVELRGQEELNVVIRKLIGFIETIQEYDQVLVRKLKTRIQKHLDKGAGELSIALVAEDMLTALKRVPGDSVSVLASGIDKCIHPEDDYSLEVEAAISRVLHPNGVYVGVGSRFQPAGLREVSKVTEDWTFRRYAK